MVPKLLPNPQSPKPVALVKPVACLVRQKDASNFGWKMWRVGCFSIFVGWVQRKRSKGWGIPGNARFLLGNFREVSKFQSHFSPLGTKLKKSLDFFKIEQSKVWEKNNSQILGIFLCTGCSVVCRCSQTRKANAVNTKRHPWHPGIV